MEKPQILWIAHSYVLPSGGVKSHSHPYYHMIHIVSGTCNFTVDGKEYVLSAGNSILIPKKACHSYLNEENENVEYLEIKFSLLKSAFDFRISRRGVQLSESALVAGLFKKILNEYSGFDNKNDDAASAYLSSILHLLSEEERLEKKNQFRFLDVSDYSELSQKIISYLEAHYHKDLSLDALSLAMGYNKSYLCVAFKKDTNLTILDCLNSIRIRRAAELVVYSEYSLSHVAEECGFASVSHFNRVFLKYVGITPGQCRRAYPADTLFLKKKPIEGQPANQFMYSVLAQKLITPQMINNLDLIESDLNE